MNNSYEILDAMVMWHLQ